MMELPIDLYNRLSESDLALLPPDLPLTNDSLIVLQDKNQI